MANQPTHRITHTSGRQVDVYITPSQISNAYIGNSSFQASICIIFRKASGYDRFIKWEDLTVSELGSLPSTRPPFMSRRDAMEQHEFAGRCCDDDDCGPCGDDQYRDHGDCRNGCTLERVA